MNTHCFRSKTQFIIMSLGLLAVAFLFLVIPQQTQAATCSITRDLQMGDINEDVRCLQRYLNSHGFPVAAVGVGSQGNETTEFKTLTHAALTKWQIANGVSPASGYFGPKSRAKLAELISGSPTVPAPSGSGGSVSNSSLIVQIAQLEAKLKSALANQSGYSKSDDKEAGDIRDYMDDVLALIEDAEDELSSIDDAKDQDEAEDNIEDAKDSFFEAVRAYLDGDYGDAEDALDDAEGYAMEALELAGVTDDEDEADDLIDEVDDRIDEAQDEIDEADDEGEETREAEDLLDEARDVLEEAKDAYDDEDYDDAIDLAEEADGLVDDALDAIGDSSNDDIEDALDDAWDELEDAWDEVNDALDDDDDVGDAEDLLEEAEDLLDEAEDALDDDDEDEAEDLIDEALDLIDEALDEL